MDVVAEANRPYQSRRLFVSLRFPRFFSDFSFFFSPFFFFFFLLFPVRLLPSVIMDIVERQNESYGRIDFHLRSIFHDDGYSILISSVSRRFVK